MLPSAPGLLCPQGMLHFEQMRWNALGFSSVVIKALLRGLVIVVFVHFPALIAFRPPLQLHHTAMQLAADLLKFHADHVVLKALKLTGVEGNLEALAEYACKLSEQKEQLVEVSSKFAY